MQGLTKRAKQSLPSCIKASHFHSASSHLYISENTDAQSGLLLCELPCEQQTRKVIFAVSEKNCLSTVRILNAYRGTGF